MEDLHLPGEYYEHAHCEIVAAHNNLVEAYLALQKRVSRLERSGRPAPSKVTNPTYELYIKVNIQAAGPEGKHLGRGIMRMGLDTILLTDEGSEMFRWLAQDALEAAQDQAEKTLTACNKETS